MDDTLLKLELLELSNAISTTLTNFIGEAGADKTLAEFVISLYEESKGENDFKTKLQEVGGDEFSDSLVASLHRLISNMHPKYKKKRPNGTANGQSNGDKLKVNALSIPDGQRWKSIEELIEEERKEKGVATANGDTRNAVAKDVDDLMGKLESVGNRRNKPNGSTNGSSGGHHNGSNGDSRRRNVSVSPPSMSNGRSRLDDKPQLYKIYDGRVSNMRDFGAFVALEGIAGRAEGMVHISSIQQGRLNHPSDVLSKGEAVKVKVMSIAGNRLSLSMKDVDQTTGRDLTPHLRVKTEKELAEEKLASMTGSNSMPLGERGRSSAPVQRTFGDDHRRSAKRLTSPERWEIKQLIASGAVSAADYPDLNDFDANKDFSNPNSLEQDEELDIEVREDEAPFLAGQGKRILELSPVKIIKAPDGTMNRAALAGTSLAKERRELRQQEVNDAADAEAKDLSSAWNDPMAQRQDRQFAADARGNFMSKQAEDTPAWKKETFNKATSFGRVTSLTMKEQREGLPIYRFREQLIEAVKNSTLR